jgi:hypothetical protein
VATTARSASAVAMEDDVLDVALNAPLKPTARPGATVKLDRAELPIIAATPAPAGTPAPIFRDSPATTAASATLVAVASTDALFQEPGVEPTVLRPNDPQEILVPLEVHSKHGVERYRLTIRLEIQSR